MKARHAGIFSRTECKKRWMTKQKEKGLCINCSKVAVYGKTRCQVHIDKEKAYRKKREQRLKKENKKRWREEIKEVNKE